MSDRLFSELPFSDARWQENAACSLRATAALHHAMIETCLPSIAAAAQALTRCFERGGKALLFGNGGSAADAQHLAAEFVGRFLKDRRPLPAIALTTDTSALTAIGNDYGYEQVFARQVRALGQPGDIAIAISTSGRSPSILAAVEAARERQIVSIGLTGGSGGLLAGLADIGIVVPSSHTPRIQEGHLCVEHILCELVEAALFPELSAL